MYICGYVHAHHIICVFVYTCIYIYMCVCVDFQNSRKILANLGILPRRLDWRLAQSTPHSPRCCIPSAVKGSPT